MRRVGALLLNYYQVSLMNDFLIMSMNLSFVVVSTDHQVSS